MISFKTAFIPVCIFFVGCKSVSYFESPNTVSKKEAVINMLDGSQKKGLLSIALETNYNANFVTLENNGSAEKIMVADIGSYIYNNARYVPMKILIDFDGPQYTMFVKKLTADSSKIQLYEFYQSGAQRDTREDLLLYYISFPSFQKMETWGMGNKNLVPEFDKKMSKLVADCPVLAEKIRNSTKGYYFSPVTLSNVTKKEVMQRIIEEYNTCK